MTASGENPANLAFRHAVDSSLRAAEGLVNNRVITSVEQQGNTLTDTSNQAAAAAAMLALAQSSLHEAAAEVQLGYEARQPSGEMLDGFSRALEIIAAGLRDMRSDLDVSAGHMDEALQRAGTASGKVREAAGQIALVGANAQMAAKQTDQANSGAEFVRQHVESLGGCVRRAAAEELNVYGPTLPPGLVRAAEDAESASQALQAAAQRNYPYMDRTYAEYPKAITAMDSAARNVTKGVTRVGQIARESRTLVHTVDNMAASVERLQAKIGALRQRLSVGEDGSAPAVPSDLFTRSLARLNEVQRWADNAQGVCAYGIEGAASLRAAATPVVDSLAVIRNILR